MGTHLKLNLGCGFRKEPDYLNVDVDPGCLPDVEIDLATTRWPWADASVSSVTFSYSLEQMGSGLAELRHVVTELYRVARPGATVAITAAHPRHDSFINNPACVHRLSPDFFQLLSFAQNMEIVMAGQHHDVFAMKWGVNFSVTRFKFLIDAAFQDGLESGRISEDQIRSRMHHENNICQAVEIDLSVVKSESDQIQVNCPGT